MFRKLIFIFTFIAALFSGAAVSQAQELNPSYGCYSAPAPRLAAGTQARVTPGLPNILRAQPYRGPYSAIIGQIPAGAVFTVLAGYAPQCGDGMFWYFVSYNGMAGWTPEGAYGVYWTEPLSSGCTALAPRLTVGSRGRVTPGLPNLLRTQSFRGSGSLIVGLIPAGATFDVIAGPSCDGAMNWWQVRYNGVTGWTGEGQYGMYWVEPDNGGIVPPPGGCAGLPTRLSPGMYARVTLGLPNTLRSSPSPYAMTIGQIPGGAMFYTLSGPQCGNNGVWWQVNYNGITGWTMEGQNGVYWLTP
jgi:hypothetical protein